MNSSSRSRCRDHGRPARPPPAARRGFTLVELLVVLAVAGVMASIFVPYAARARESDRRVRCYDNLMRLSAALRDYAAGNGHNYPATRADGRGGYACYTGGDDPAAVRPNDVTASLWLLVRLRLAAPRDFICPSTDDTAGPYTASPHAANRGNFRSPAQLSYSYACPFSAAADYRLNDTRRPDFALVADRNPGPSAARPTADAPPLQLAAANSPNHGRSGQNVLYADGHAEFCRSPYCGVDRDDVYSAQRQTPWPPRGAKARIAGRADVGGVVSPSVGPSAGDDTYLVPTAADGHPRRFPSPASRWLP